MLAQHSTSPSKLIEKANLNPVGVCCDEIQRTVSTRAVVDELWHPAVTRSCGTSDSKLRRYLFDRICRHRIKVEVSLLICSPKAIQIRLVPNLEIPFLNLVKAIALGPVFDQRGD